MPVFSYTFPTGDPTEVWDEIINTTNYWNGQTELLTYIKALKDFMVANYTITTEIKDTFNYWLALQPSDVQTGIGFIL